METHVFSESTKIVAFYIAEAINLKQLKSDFTANLLTSSTTELLFSIENSSYMYVFNYGVVVFANLPDVEMSRLINYLHTYSTNLLEHKIDEQYHISLSANNSLAITSKGMEVPSISENVIRIAMITLAESVGLDFYTRVSEELLEEVKKITTVLEMKGSISVGRTEMLKFIGKTLNTQNRIAENLYIFDSPDLVWDDDYLDKIHIQLVRNFELRNRYKEIEFMFNRITESLSVFRALAEHRENRNLEWIVIILILIEVVNMFISKIH